MRLSLATLIAAALVFGTAPAAGQPCAASMIALRVHDARGDVMDPTGLRIEYRPLPARAREFAVERREISIRDVPHEPVPAIVWYGRACILDLREVVIRQGRTVLRLWMDLHLDARAEGRSARFVLDTPPLATGTWRLDVCRLPPADEGGLAQVPLVWVRVSESGNPRERWQPPFGCERDRPR